MAAGETLYKRHCADCHGERGEGVAGIYPPLAGSRMVALDPPNNAVQLVRHGGFPPSTAGNPRPFGMPPFGQVLSDDDVAALLTWLRQGWGRVAPAVTTLEVARVR